MEGQGTELNIYRMLRKIEELENTKEQEEIIWILFLDFAKAYDMVNHQRLFEKMKEMNISTEVIEGLKMMFNNLTIPTKRGNLCIGRGLG